MGVEPTPTDGPNDNRLEPARELFRQLVMGDNLDVMANCPLPIEPSGENYCETCYFKRYPHIHEHTVLYLDNRPGEDVHLYERDIAALCEQAMHYRQVAAQLSSTDPHHANLSGEDLMQLIGAEEPFAPPDVLRIFEASLPSGHFRDTTKVAEWLGTVDRRVRFEDFDLPSPTLNIAHADSHIDEIIEQVINRGIRPAAIIASGSPLMLGDNEVWQMPRIQKTCQLIKHAVDNNIPFFGICFGLHLLSAAAFGVRPEYLTVPDGYHFERRIKLDASVPCTPGKRRMIYGSRSIKTIRHRRSWITNKVKDVLALKVHSQFLDRYHPTLEPHVLAVSSRFFAQDKDTVNANARTMMRQQVVEVLKAGPVAYGSQLHPELDAELLNALSYVPQYRDILDAEGQDLDLLRRELRLHPDGYWAGARIGYNFINRIVVPQMTMNAPGIGMAEKKTLLARQYYHGDPPTEHNLLGDLMHSFALNVGPTNTYLTRG